MTGLGDRMKGYESCFDTVLPWRMPLIIRVDGQAFHTLTRKMEKPWDKNFIHAMNYTAVELCTQIPGACLAYIQSDEISVLVNGYRSINSEPWFGNRLQKITSTTGAIASVVFSQYLLASFVKYATFDSRAFVLPEAEIVNYFLWRQRDAERNSIQSLARSLASHKECHGLKTADLQELCFQRGTNWNDVPTSEKRGRCCVKVAAGPDAREGNIWAIDPEIPRFVEEGRSYIEGRFFPEEE